MDDETRELVERACSMLVGEFIELTGDAPIKLVAFVITEHGAGVAVSGYEQDTSAFFDVLRVITETAERNERAAVARARARRPQG
jgi:predicted secreted protein